MFNSVGAWFYRYLAGIQPHGDWVEVRPVVGKEAGLLRRVAAEEEVGGVGGMVRVGLGEARWAGDGRGNGRGRRTCG